MRFFRAFREPFSLPTFLRANLSAVPGKPSPLLSQPIFKLSLAGEHSGLNVYFMSNQRIYARQNFMTMLIFLLISTLINGLIEGGPTPVGICSVAGEHRRCSFHQEKSKYGLKLERSVL